MRLTPLLDGRVDWIERGLWLTVPFDLPQRRARTGDAIFTNTPRLGCALSLTERLNADMLLEPRLVGGFAALRI